MGRPRSKHFDLPPRMAARALKTRTLYYYCCADGRRIPLGPDLAAAKQRWAELETGDGAGRGMAAVFDRFKAKALAGKAPRTQREYERQLDTLRAAFGVLDISQVQPLHVRQYLDRRSKKIAANREIALLSLVWNWARETGLTDRPNPCAGVRKHRERARARYVTDAEYQAVYEHAPEWLRIAMDLALATTQRPGDILAMTHQDIQDGHLWIEQHKTRARLGIEITPELDALIKRATAGKIASRWLIHDNGQRVTIFKLGHEFARVRKLAGQDWQFRDLRAKSTTDEPDLRIASQRAGHADETTTAGVYRRVRGNKVAPLKK